MTYKFAEERFVDVYPEMVPILKEHYEELAINKDVRPLDVDVDGYTRINDLGFLRIRTCRGEDNKLVGYAAFLIKENLHYKTWVNAICDVYYISKDERKTGLGYLFFLDIKDWLKTYKVNSVITQTKKDHPHAKFFEILGFKPIEDTYELVF